MLAASIVLWFFPEALVGIFLNTDDPTNADVLQIAVSFSIYAGFFLLIDGTLMVVTNGLRGLRDTKSTFWISVIAYWAIGIGLGGWLSFSVGYGAAGLWFGLVAGAIAGIVMALLRFRTQLVLAEEKLL